MSLPFGYRLRKGDVVVLHGTVKFDVDDGDTDVHVIVAYRPFTVALEEVVGVHAYGWKVGDEVFSPTFGQNGSLVAIHQTVWAWVDFDLAGLQTCLLEMLRPPSKDVPSFTSRSDRLQPPSGGPGAVHLDNAVQFDPLVQPPAPGVREVKF